MIVIESDGAGECTVKLRSGEVRKFERKELASVAILSEKERELSVDGVLKIYYPRMIASMQEEVDKLKAEVEEILGKLKGIVECLERK